MAKTKTSHNILQLDKNRESPNTKKCHKKVISKFDGFNPEILQCFCFIHFRESSVTVRAVPGIQK